MKKQYNLFYGIPAQAYIAGEVFYASIMLLLPYFLLNNDLNEKSSF